MVYQQYNAYPKRQKRNICSNDLAARQQKRMQFDISIKPNNMFKIHIKVCLIYYLI